MTLSAPGSFSSHDAKGEYDHGQTIYHPQTGEPLIRHSDMWFLDGSIVCRAENYVFRVHISQLARHSVCFRDMFALASSPMPGPSTQVEIEGCPAVTLHDKAEDVSNLLTALYDGPSFGNNDYNDFRMVSGILRLSTKYVIDSLREKALLHLSKAWPCTLKGWDAREDTLRRNDADLTIRGGYMYPSPIDVINLAREVDAPSLLPSAFYDLSRYTISQIFEPSEDEPLYTPPSQPVPMLSLHDTQRLVLGKEAAQQTITALIQAMGSSPRTSHSAHMTHIRRTSSGGICMSAAACRRDFSELVDLATQHYLFDRERGCSDPLYVAEELGQLKSTEFSECKACARSLETWACREREKMWKLIPVWFRLDHLEIGSPKITSD